MNQIKTILFGHLLGFLGSTALCSMAANAVISTAPAMLPKFREFPQWLWTWMISSARQFWSLHHPQQPQPFPNETAPNAGQKEK